MREFKEQKIPLSFYYWIHSYIQQSSIHGKIEKHFLKSILRMYFNIEKRMCPIIIRELEILGLLKKDNGYMIVKPTEPKEEMLKRFENQLLYGEI